MRLAPARATVLCARPGAKTGGKVTSLPQSSVRRPILTLVARVLDDKTSRRPYAHVILLFDFAIPPVRACLQSWDRRVARRAVFTHAPCSGIMKPYATVTPFSGLLSRPFYLVVPRVSLLPSFSRSSRARFCIRIWGPFSILPASFHSFGT